MNKIDILFKCITLLFRESLLDVLANGNSKDIIKTVIVQMKATMNKRPILGGTTDIEDELINLCLSMCDSADGYDKLNLLQTLEVLLKDQGSLYSTIEKSLNVDMEPSGLKRSIVALRNRINDYYREQEITRLIKAASYQLSLGQAGESIQDIGIKLCVNLEALTNNIKSKDTGIVDEIDILDGDELDKVFNKVKKQTIGTGRLTTGWRELNVMLGGGLRYGETVLISALQHNFKSGFLRSLFAQLCMYNKPELINKDRKPLNLFISFEDDTDIITEFFYKYLYFAETGNMADLTLIDPKELSTYLKTQLTRTGFNVKFIRANPSEWTYKTLFNKILEYEASGYELKVVVTDYLSKLPTTFCDNSGPLGTAFRDMLTRVRDFMSARQVLYLNAHQMSVDAKQLIRNGVPAKDLVKEVANKGYYEGSKQLDQVVDLELYQHIAKLGKNKYYLTVQRGKRRYPEIIDDDKKYFMLPFPTKESSIPPNIDLDGNYIGFKYSQEDSINLGDDTLSI